MGYDFADATGPAGDVLCDEYVQECCKFRWFGDCHEFAHYSDIVFDGRVGTLVLPYMMEVETTNSDKTQSLVYPAELFFPLIAKDCQLSPPPLCASTQSKTTGEICGTVLDNPIRPRKFIYTPLSMFDVPTGHYLFAYDGKLHCWTDNDDNYAVITWGSDAR